MTARINSKSCPLGCTLHTRKVPTHNFGNIRCPILHIKTNSTPQCWWCLVRRPVYRKLNWKLTISNEADNTNITHSCDSRHRRMQDVNSLCTDSGLLRANTVLCHSTNAAFYLADASEILSDTTSRWKIVCNCSLYFKDCLFHYQPVMLLFIVLFIA